MSSNRNPLILALIEECVRLPKIGCLCKPAPIFTLLLPGGVYSYFMRLVALGLFTDCDPSFYCTLCVCLWVPLLVLVFIFLTIWAIVALVIGFVMDVVVCLSWIISCGFCCFCCPWREDRWDDCGCCMVHDHELNWDPCTPSNCLACCTKTFHTDKMTCDN